MTSTEPPEPCPYRDSRVGYLLCRISPGGMPSNKQFTNTNLTYLELCRECKIPQVVKQVNCLNLSVGKQHEAISTGSGDIGFNSQNDHQINCTIYPFEDSDNFEQKCSEECPSYRPIHRSVFNEDRVVIKDFDANNATDRQLRQAILAILYQYHARHPERFNCFDVTPEFIGECLGITVTDIVRVVAPMEEEEEVTTKRYAHDTHFRYVTIRSKGIRMIDEEPLFERLNTAQVRDMNFYGPSYGVAGHVQGDQKVLRQDS